jgi:hypothetical protein
MCDEITEQENKEYLKGVSRRRFSKLTATTALMMMPNATLPSQRQMDRRIATLWHLRAANTQQSLFGRTSWDYVQRFARWESA